MPKVAYTDRRIFAPPPADHAQQIQNVQNQRPIDINAFQPTDNGVYRCPSQIESTLTIGYICDVTYLPASLPKNSGRWWNQCAWWWNDTFQVAGCWLCDNGDNETVIFCLFSLAVRHQLSGYNRNGQRWWKLHETQSGNSSSHVGVLSRRQLIDR